MEKGNLFGELYDIIKKNSRLIIIITAVAALAAFIFSSPAFMKPRFKSTAAVYPINIIPHSDESETEQMLQLFAHEEIKESVLNEFNLYERWDLNPNDPEYRYWSNLLYQERVSIGPTRYESVEIVTQDEDPQVAKDMAVFIIDKFNEVTSRGDKEMHLKYRVMKEFEIKRLDSIMDILEARITAIRIESGITDYESQSERVIEGYLDLLKSGASRSKLEEVEKMIMKLSNDGGEIEVIREKIDGLKEYNADLTEELIMATSRTLSGLDYAKVIVEPKVADKKSYPVRWIIMVLSVLFGGLAAVILVIFKERLISSS